MATKKEIETVLALLACQYTLNKEKNAIVNLWVHYFQNVPAPVLMHAAELYMMEDDSPYNNFPKIGNIIGILKREYRDRRPSVEEAWQRVRKAVSRGRAEVKKEFEALPAILQEALGSHTVLLEYLSEHTGDYDRSKMKAKFTERYLEAVDRELLGGYGMVQPQARIPFDVPEKRTALPEPDPAVEAFLEARRCNAAAAQGDVAKTPDADELPEALLELLTPPKALKKQSA